MLNCITVTCLDRNCHTYIFSIRNLIFRIVLKIPQFKFIGLEYICLRFISKFIIISTGNTELHIIRQIDSGHSYSITAVIFLCELRLLFFCKIFFIFCRAFIFFDVLVCSIKDIILICCRS